MRDEPLHNEGGCPDLEGSALLRAAADGELTPEQAAEVEALVCRCNVSRCRVEFERELRSACGRVMSKECCPEALKAKIRAMAANAVAEADAVAQGVEARASETRSRSFWTGSRVIGLVAAAAAVIGLAATAVLLVRTPAPTAATGQLQYVQFRDRVAKFVANEHERCWESESAADAKFVMKDPEQVKAEFQEMLGHRIDLAVWDQPTQGLVFRGAGKCHVPGSDGKSVHLRFDIPATADRPATAVSLFVAPDRGELPIKPGITYAVDTGPCGAPGESVLVWTAEGTVFYLVADAKAGGCDKLRKALGVPAATGGL